MGKRSKNMGTKQPQSPNVQGAGLAVVIIILFSKLTSVIGKFGTSEAYTMLHS